MSDAAISFCLVVGITTYCFGCIISHINKSIREYREHTIDLKLKEEREKLSYYVEQLRDFNN